MLSFSSHKEQEELIKKLQLLVAEQRMLVQLMVERGEFLDPGSIGQYIVDIDKTYRNLQADYPILLKQK